MKLEEFLEWKSKIPDLTPDQVMVTLASLKQLNPNLRTESEPDPQDDWFLNGLFLAMRKNGLIRRSGIIALRRSKAMMAYNRNAAAVKRDLESLLGKNRKGIAQMSLAYLAGVSLIIWCKKNAQVVSAAIVLKNIAHTMEAIEDQFPGYIDSKLFHMVLKTQSI